MLQSLPQQQRGSTMQDVNGKIAVITGAASGIGRGMAETFAAAGMKVVLSDIEGPALHAATQQLRDAGAQVHAVQADVSKPEQVEQLAEATLQKYGAVHVLCNNAGVSAGVAPSWTSTLSDWNWIIGVNLLGVVHGVRTFLPIMIAQGTPAHIVNTASMAGLTASGGNMLYTVTKFGVVALSESLYLELQQSGSQTSVSVLCPGYVDTNILNCQRNRPAAAHDISPPPGDSVGTAFREWLGEQLKQGLSPRAVGEQVLAAIREQRFYILTHPEWNGYIEHRMQSILSGSNPQRLPVPNVESLQSKLAALGVRLP
jgi:NAD(P)-dependent dehydrogenase (short-subunit alcohol dehydrogenase family)